MLEIVRQQMICILVPGWDGTTDLSESGSVCNALDALFEEVEVVQFASIALLPARVDAKDSRPSLMLELAIEEGITPYDMLYRLVYHASGAMWSLYSSFWPGDATALQSERNNKLLEKLMAGVSIADGGFIGARDRTARQIKKEQELLQWTRDQARAMKATKQYGDDRAAFALALAQRAFDEPRFDWALDPAPRSYWRGKGAGILAKVGYVLAIFVLYLAAVWLVGAVPRGVLGIYTWLFGAPYSGVQAVVDAVCKASGWVLGVSIRGALALVGLGYLAWLFLVALPAVSKSWRRWLKSVGRELDRPTETWSSWSTYWVGWIVGVPSVVAVVAFALVFIFCPGTIVGAYHALTAKFLGWQIIAFIILAIVALICVVGVLSRIDQQLAAGNWFFHPYEDDVPRAQQVYTSIDYCEGLVVHETAHMISLTDVRRPNGWNAWWIRTSLRIVTLFGRVFFTEGRLGSAPGIHFGHWHIIEEGRRYLFCSNYDGSFGGYLDDFINGATIGTTLAWRWTTLKPRESAAIGQPAVEAPRSFPPTRFIVFRGVRCELKFKSYARDSMLPHMFRFDARKETVDQINLATGLRDALFGERNDSNDDLIMRAIES
ncbi:hypothetical protein IVA80_17395 [Bradyrhizobium sp. 139]|uniref:hypothetical protein n=1 Tax=Bradyrhizobium sp. 139 TaxID=2782616 RepID=UPI001FFBED8B|nr:hypothetical protein [Bradyrhizobium sp. 139]MCK1742592.1 hypothetical protein [Bradyrhizobium sp. 139]